MISFYIHSYLNVLPHTGKNVLLYTDEPTSRSSVIIPPEERKINHVYHRLEAMSHFLSVSAGELVSGA